MFRKMRRSKQELTKEECIEILKKEPRGVLSVQGEDGYPYGMPMTHWYNEKDEKSISTEQNLVIRLMPSKIVTKFHSVLWTRDIERKENGH